MIKASLQIRLMIIFRRKMLTAEEVREILIRVPYPFSEEELPDPTIRINNITAHDRLVNLDITYNEITPEMAWILLYNTIPPSTMHHDPAIQDNCGNTCAMFWTMFCEGDIPSCLRHNPLLSDMSGTTCAMLWLMYRTTPVPKYIRHNPSYRTHNGYTCAMYWIDYRWQEDVLPRYLRCNRNIYLRYEGKDMTCSKLWWIKRCNALSNSHIPIYLYSRKERHRLR